MYHCSELLLPVGWVTICIRKWENVHNLSCIPFSYVRIVFHLLCTPQLIRSCKRRVYQKRKPFQSHMKVPYFPSVIVKYLRWKVLCCPHMCVCHIFFKSTIFFKIWTNLPVPSSFTLALSSRLCCSGPGLVKVDISMINMAQPIPLVWIVHTYKYI